MKAKINELLLRVESLRKIIGTSTSYGLYDKKTHEYINIENKDRYFDYATAYDRIWSYFFIIPDSFIDSPVDYLYRHNGQLYCPMLMKDNQKAYIFNFDVTKIPGQRRYGVDVTVNEPEYKQMSIFDYMEG